MTRWTPEQVQDHMLKFQNKGKAKALEQDEGKESLLQKKCEQWLKMKGFHYCHDRSRKKNPPGMFLDLHIYLPAGRHVVCELKAKGNKMSTEQVETYRKLMFLGHEIHEVRSFKQFLEIMNK